MIEAEKERLADDVQGMLGKLELPDYHGILRILSLRRPWRPTRTGLTNMLDQLLHALYAVIIFLPVIVWPSLATAGLSGLLVGAIREWEQWKNQDYQILMFWDRFQDAAFFAVGAMILYYATQLIRG
jgi:hypothetical protein